jgi:hypothetical protein
MRPQIAFCRSSMQAALDAFEANMLRVHSLHALHGVFVKQVTTAVDLSDLLRAEIVLAVSALDHYMHELTRLGMLECWRGTRTRTDAFNRFPLPISVAVDLSNLSIAQEIIESEIRSKHSFLSFQHPDKIAEAVRLFSDGKLWEEVGKSLGMAAKDVKTSLLLIIDRRNKIAHEADIDPSYPGQRWPIDSAMVENTLLKLDAIAHAIFKVIV